MLPGSPWLAYKPTTQLLSQKFQGVDHHTYTNSVDLPFQKHGLYYGIAPHFCEVIISSTLLWRFSIRIWGVSVEMCAHLAKRTFVWSGTDVRQEDMARDWQSNSPWRYSVRLRWGLCAGHPRYSRANCSNHVFMKLEKKKGPSPYCGQKVGIIQLFKISLCTVA